MARTLSDGKEVGAARTPKEQARIVADFIAPFKVKPGSKVRLPRDFSPSNRGSFLKKADGEALLAVGVQLLSEYQEKLAAQNQYGLLVVLQAMDAAGKDGTIRHVMSGVNPQGVKVTSFKAPSAEELDHDYLWRAAKALPARGEIGIFNRSYYEEVLIARVHPQILERQHLPKEARGPDVWKLRYRQMNDWERYLVENGFRVVKIFLNVSHDEQRKRLLRRIDDPSRNWKFEPADLEERRFWDDYQKAYSEMLSATSTEIAPWYVVPADAKWFARMSAAAIIVDALLKIDPHFPEARPEVLQKLPEYRAALTREMGTDSST